jgi:two-component system chemotaxis response regulator CheB
MSTRIFVIGASHSGLQALCGLVARLPANFPAPVFIVQHTAREGRSRLPELLSKAGPLPASHPRAGESIRPGHIYVAPPDHHMLVRPKYVWLSRGPRENQIRPAVDPLFRSAALAYGAAVVGVVLTGYLDDGTAGAVSVKLVAGPLWCRIRPRRLPLPCPPARSPMCQKWTIAARWRRSPHSSYNSRMMIRRQ